MDIKCPQCGNPTQYTKDNAFRPFCSKRCQLIDLGEWADEKKAIPGETASPDEIDEEISKSRSNLH